MSFNTGTCSSTQLLEEIKELIKDEGLTQEEFGKEVGYSRKALNRIIRGKTRVSFDTIVDLCKRLGIKAITID